MLQPLFCFVFDHFLLFCVWKQNNFPFCKLPARVWLMCLIYLGVWNDVIENSRPVWVIERERIFTQTKQNRTKHSYQCPGTFFSIQCLYVKAKSSSNWGLCGDSTTYFDAVNIDYLEGQLSLDINDLVPNTASVIIYNLCSLSVS